MKSKLQKKEIFIPLSVGAETGTDPRVPKSPVVECENAVFPVGGSVSKRDPMAVLCTGKTQIRKLGSAGGVLYGLGSGIYSIGANGATVTIDGRWEAARSDVVTLAHSPSSAESAGVGGLIPVTVNVVTSSGNGIAAIYSPFVVHPDGTLLYTSSPSQTIFKSAVESSSGNGAWLYNFYEEPQIDFYSANNQTINSVGGMDVEPLGLVSIGGDLAIGVEVNTDGNVYVVVVDCTDASVVSSNVVATHHLAGGSLFGSSAAHVATSNGSALVAVVVADGVDSGTAVNLIVGHCTYDVNGVVDVVSSCTVAVGSTNSNYTPLSISLSTDSGLIEELDTVSVLCAFRGFGVWHEDNRPRTVSVDLQIAPPPLGLTEVPFTGTYTLGNGVVCYDMAPCGPAFSSKRYPMLHMPHAWWTNSVDSAVASATAQCSMIAISVGGSATWPSPPSSPVARILTSPTASYPSRVSGGPLHSGLATAVPGVASRIARIDLNTNTNDISAVDALDGACIGSGWPMYIYGNSSVCLGSPEYPEQINIVQTNSALGNWTNSGGVGDYFYAITYGITCNGRSSESASSYSTQSTITNNSSYVTLKLPRPSLCELSSKSPETRIYRTSESGNDYFLVGVASYGERTFRDYGKIGFTVNAGLDKILSASALYTQSGELENVYPPQHSVSAIHAGRYFYLSREGLVAYSKSIGDRFSPGFNEVLEAALSPDGGSVVGMVSFSDKLFIAREGLWNVLSGDPLNDAGSGYSMSPPRIVARGSGASGAMVQCPIGIAYVCSADGLIYLIAGNESVSPIGAPVSAQCRANSYSVAWHAPQDRSIRFSSSDSGAPTLSFDYSVGQWSTYTGVYAGGVRDAISHDFGNGMVDVVLLSGGNVYVQDKSSNSNSTESYTLSIESSWISLNDIAGYGRLYGWTLLGGKPNSGALSLEIKTAYDYEPHWTDNQTYNASSLNNFSIDNQFSMNSANTIIDNALKISVDGSRHKTDAIRISVKDTNGLSRNNIEIIGARLEIGVKPGMTRLGSAREV